MTIRTEIHVREEHEIEIEVRYFDTFATCKISIKDNFTPVHHCTYFFSLEKIEQFLEFFRTGKIKIENVTKEESQEKGDN